MCLSDADTSGNYTGDGIQTLEKVGISIVVMWDSREIFCYIVYYYITPAASTACHGCGNTYKPSWLTVILCEEVVVVVLRGDQRRKTGQEKEGRETFISTIAE